MAETELSKRKCVPCQGGTPPLNHQQVTKLLTELHSDWKVKNNHHLEKEFRFPDFKKALDFTVQIGNLAEEEDHHPDILLCWGKVKVTLWTHKINGLSESDFIMAAKIDTLSR